VTEDEEPTGLTGHFPTEYEETESSAPPTIDEVTEEPTGLTGHVPTEYEETESSAPPPTIDEVTEEPTGLTGHVPTEYEETESSEEPTGDDDDWEEPTEKPHLPDINAPPSIPFVPDDDENIPGQYDPIPRAVSPFVE